MASTAFSTVPKPLMTITDGGGDSSPGLAEDLQSMGTGLVEIQVGDDQIRVVGAEGVDDAAVVGEGKTSWPSARSTSATICTMVSSSSTRMIFATG